MTKVISILCAVKAVWTVDEIECWGTKSQVLLSAVKHTVQLAIGSNHAQQGIAETV